MARAGWSMAGLAFVATGLSALIPALGLLVGLLAALIIGAGAGWWASKLMGGGSAGRGAGAGSIAGLGALLGLTVGSVVLFSIIGNSPEAQEALNQAQQQNPDAQVPGLGVAALAGFGGGLVGLCFGIFALLASMIGGLVASLVYGNRGATVAPATVGGYVPQSSTLPQMTSQTDYNTRPFPQQSSDLPGNASGESNVRTYPSDDDENRARIYPDNDQR